MRRIMKRLTRATRHGGWSVPVLLPISAAAGRGRERSEARWPPPREARCRRRLRGALAAVLLALSPAAAQELPLDEPVKSFGERLDVEVVEVEVRVLDRKDRPVTGLTRERFQLYEDGRPVEIEYFAEYQELEREGPASRTPEAVAPGSPGSPAAPPPVADTTHLVIFLDHLHLEPGGRKRVLADLQAFVETGIPPGVPVMVVSFVRSVEVVQPFTTDRAAVARALAGQEKGVAGGIFGSVRHRGTRQDLEAIYRQYENTPFCDVPCQCAFSEMEARVRQYAGETSNDVENTLSGLASVSSALRGVAGRKVLLLVNDGLEARPGLDLFHYIADLCPQLENEVARNYTSEDLLGAIQDVTSDAASNRVTIYSLEAAGLRGDAADMTVASRQFRPSNLTLRMQVANLQQSLFILADETGGEAVLNANRFAEELGEVAEDMGTYYSLGFTPRHGGDGEAHVLRVEVDAPHHQVRYRKAYRDKPLETRIAEGALASLVFGYEENPLGMALEVGEPTPGDAGRYRVPVRVRVPLAALVLNPSASSLVGQVRLVMTARDGDGNWTPVRQKMVGVRAAPGEEPAGAERMFEVEIELPAGEHVLVVGVRDEIGGAISYLRKTFEIE